MERGRVALVSLVYVLISSTSGAEVEMRVSPGDNVTLYSDCVWRTGFDTVWFRNSSHEHMVLKPEAHVRYSIISNICQQTSDLLVKNVSESDLGLYYCALQKKRASKDEALHYGRRATRLSFLETTPGTPSTPPVSDCSVCWKLLVSVCPVCVLLSSVVSSTCVYCIYRNRTEVTKEKEDNTEEGEKMRRRRSDKVGGDDVCYASLNLPNRQPKHLKKKKRVESSEFCTYSEVKTAHI